MTVNRSALLSVSDKRGVVDFARALVGLQFTLLSTGGTAKALREAGLAVTDVGDYTGFPEMLDGRVKTLHPKVHGGILARRDDAAHMQAIAAAQIPTIDLVVVNLYPFRETVAKPGCTLEDAIENIDIGGPTMVRAAAKNYGGVGIVVDPDDYVGLTAELQRSNGALSHATRFTLARKAFSHTAAYDSAISNWLTARDETNAAVAFPAQFNLNVAKVQDLRYGENPHQSAAFYRDLPTPEGSIAAARQLQGKELSYNNLADADAAWECVKNFPESAACVIVKHANPCGVAVAADALAAYKRAFACDPTSAFGGIIAFNCEVNAATVEAVSSQFLEVLIAPTYTDDALALIAKKTNVRVLAISMPKNTYAATANALDYKRVGGGLLVQSADAHEMKKSDLKCVTANAPSDAQLDDLLFAWRVAKFVKSNAIVFVKNGATVGIGAGQMSRLDSARIAGIKAQHAGLSLRGSVAASDAFFPFRDGLDVIADAGAVAVIQPGGSMRDGEVIAAANERGVTMVVTGVRHFRH
jgi:phosphoribosylaminoimidazolecarboxamide formyltransferase / IMP cyclohydrolase